MGILNFRYALLIKVLGSIVYLFFLTYLFFYPYDSCNILQPSAVQRSVATSGRVKYGKRALSEEEEKVCNNASHIVRKSVYLVFAGDTHKIFLIQILSKHNTSLSSFMLEVFYFHVFR